MPSALPLLPPRLANNERKGSGLWSYISGQPAA